MSAGLAFSLQDTQIGTLQGVSLAASGLFGPKNTCPICGQRSNFMPFGEYRERPRIVCRFCGSHDRHRLLYLYLKDRTRIFQDRLSLLHFSPEKGLQNLFERQKNLTYKTSWYEPDRPADYHLDLTALDLVDASWDVFIVFHILEHIPDDRAAMREMFRVLKPGGFAVISSPIRDEPDTLEESGETTPEERTRLFLQHDHVRFYGWKDLADRLTEAGFEVAIEEYGRELPEEVVREYRLNRNGRIYIARKPARQE